MSDGFEFLWIDDEQSMKSAADNLAKNTGAKVQFHNLFGQDLVGRISALMQEFTPDLVIVDHKLDRTVGALNTLKATGATAAEAIKDFNPQMPVVCITKVDIENDLTFAQRSAYDAVLSATDLTRQSRVILSIAEGFRTIKDKPPKNEEAILRLLDCPQVDRIRLLQVLPNNIKTGFERKGYASLLRHWIVDVLFARPGFLYDSLWSATLVGASEDFFGVTQDKLLSAKYRGIFANDVDPRWWASKILEILYQYQSSPTIEQDDPRLLGRAYLGVPLEKYSKCAISNKDLPDSVAYTDTTNKKRMQVCLQYTKEHPEFQKLLFFEDIRIITEDE